MIPSKYQYSLAGASAALAIMVLALGAIIILRRARTRKVLVPKEDDFKSIAYSPDSESLAPSTNSEEIPRELTRLQTPSPQPHLLSVMPTPTPKFTDDNYQNFKLAFPIESRHLDPNADNATVIRALGVMFHAGYNYTGRNLAQEFGPDAFVLLLYRVIEILNPNPPTLSEVQDYLNIQLRPDDSLEKLASDDRIEGLTGIVASAAKTLLAIHDSAFTTRTLPSIKTTVPHKTDLEMNTDFEEFKTVFHFRAIDIDNAMITKPEIAASNFRNPDRLANPLVRAFGHLAFDEHLPNAAKFQHHDILLLVFHIIELKAPGQITLPELRQFFATIIPEPSKNPRDPGPTEFLLRDPNYKKVFELVAMVGSVLVPIQDRIFNRYVRASNSNYSSPLELASILNMLRIVENYTRGNLAAHTNEPITQELQTKVRDQNIQSMASLKAAFNINSQDFNGIKRAFKTLEPLYDKMTIFNAKPTWMREIDVRSAVLFAVIEDICRVEATPNPFESLAEAREYMRWTYIHTDSYDPDYSYQDHEKDKVKNLKDSSRKEKLLEKASGICCDAESELCYEDTHYRKDFNKAFEVYMYYKSLAVPEVFEEGKVVFRGVGRINPDIAKKLLKEGMYTRRTVRSLSDYASNFILPQKTYKAINIDLAEPDAKARLLRAFEVLGKKKSYEEIKELFPWGPFSTYIDPQTGEIRELGQFESANMGARVGYKHFVSALTSGEQSTQPVFFPPNMTPEFSDNMKGGYTNGGISTTEGLTKARNFAYGGKEKSWIFVAIIKSGYRWKEGGNIAEAEILVPCIEPEEMFFAFDPYTQEILVEPGKEAVFERFKQYLVDNPESEEVYVDQETGFKIKIDLQVRAAVIGRADGIPFEAGAQYSDAEIATRRINQFAHYINLWNEEADRCMKEENHKIVELELVSAKGKWEIERSGGG